MTDFSTFDVISYLEDRDIDCHKAGEKNVSRGWIGIHCPFPGCDDPSWHCGINLESKFFNCWHCLEKGPPNKLVRELERCSWAEANTILDHFQNTPSDGQNGVVGRGSDPDTHNPIRSEDILPRGCLDEFPKMHTDYLEERGFDPEEIIPKYKLRAVYNVGEYKFRIIIPVFKESKLVSFTTRTVLDSGVPTYLPCPNDRGLVPIKETIYNLDNVRESMLVVEGPLDVWAIGDGAVATLSDQFTSVQWDLIRRKGVRRAFVMFDAEPQAQKLAYKLALILDLFVDHVEILSLDFGDPAEMPRDMVLDLRMDLGL